MGIKVTDKDNTDKLLKTLKEIESSVIEVGIFSKAGGDIVLIANVHEFGSNKNNIPERSFLRAGFDKYNKDIADLCDKMITRAVMQEISVDTALNTIGAFAVSKIQEFLTDMKRPPLKPLTIQRKGSSALLIDTGRLRQSITYRIK